MAQLLYSIESDSLPSDAHVVAFSGHEAISEPYCFQIGMQTGDEQFDPAKAVRAKTQLTFNLGSGADPYFIHGILREIELVHNHGGKALYRLALVPRLWNLTHTLHSRIFTDLTICEIIEKILKNGGLTKGQDFELKVMASYPKLEHVCQYKESHLAFISRWMQREGLYYFFEQKDEGEKLVITDSLSFHGGLKSGTVRYVPTGNEDFMSLEHLSYFGARHAATPADVLLTDYDYLRPAMDLQAGHPVDADGQGQIQIFGENIINPGEAKRYAQVRAEELLAKKLTFNAEGRAFHLRPNYRFTLDGHPDPRLDGQSYLVTELEHAGNQSGADARTLRRLGLSGIGSDEYAVTLTAIRDDVQLRAARQTPWPRIDGYELGDICGDSASDYAQIDDHGRYKCRVYFDEGTMTDGKASTWIRMMQPHGGGNEGFHFPLRKGTEVALFFLSGDPDRPVIAGVVPNALKNSPINKSNHTKNVIQTGGKNLIEIEDQAGSECFHMSTPHSGTFIRMGAVRTGGGPAAGPGGAVHRAKGAGAGSSTSAGSAAASAAAAEWPPLGTGLSAAAERLGLTAAACILLATRPSPAAGSLPRASDELANGLRRALELLRISPDLLGALARVHGCAHVAGVLRASKVVTDVMMPDDARPLGQALLGSSGEQAAATARVAPSAGATARSASLAGEDGTLGVARTTLTGTGEALSLISEALDRLPGPPERPADGDASAPAISVEALLGELTTLAHRLRAESGATGANGERDQDIECVPAPARLQLLVDALRMHQANPSLATDMSSSSRPWSPENTVGPALSACEPTSVTEAPAVPTAWFNDPPPVGAHPPAPAGHPPAPGAQPGSGDGALPVCAPPGVEIHTGGDRTDEHHDCVIQTNHNHREKIVGLEDIEVMQTFHKHVHGDETLDLDSNVTEHVGINFTKTIGGNEKVTVTGHVTETIGGGETKKVTGIVTENILGAEFKNVVGPEVHINDITYTHLVGAAATHVVVGLESQIHLGTAIHYHLGGHRDYSPTTHLHGAAKVEISSGGMCKVESHGYLMLDGGHVTIHGPTKIFSATEFVEKVEIGGNTTLKRDLEIGGNAKLAKRMTADGQVTLRAEVNLG